MSPVSTVRKALDRLHPDAMMKRQVIVDDPRGDWWYSSTAFIVKWSVILGIILIFFVWCVGGYYHVKYRVKKGKPPLAYHRWLLPRSMRPGYAPTYAAQHHHQHAYHMEPLPQPYPEPPPVYDPNSPPQYYGPSPMGPGPESKPQTHGIHMDTSASTPAPAGSRY